MNLVEHRRAVLVLVQAGNILADAAACGLVLWSDVDLVLEETFVNQGNGV